MNFKVAMGSSRGIEELKGCIDVAALLLPVADRANLGLRATSGSLSVASNRLN